MDTPFNYDKANERFDNEYWTPEVARDRMKRDRVMRARFGTKWLLERGLIPNDFPRVKFRP